MKTLTNHITTSTTVADRETAFLAGYDDGINGRRDNVSRETIASHREAVGFNATATDLLTPPTANMKLDKSATLAFGLTLYHYIMGRFNACPWAGDCTAVCVLNNGNGRYSSVQNAWKWRTNFLADDTLVALYRVGWELGRAVRKHGRILFRPNVNSDLLWHRIIPSLGALVDVSTYGYSKNPAVLSTDGNVGGIRTAYSWSESSDIDRVRAFLQNGGSVAVVTNRRPKSPVDTGLVRDALGVDSSVSVADADVTDEWMFEPGTIGDLSAKGKARQLVGRSGFVVCAY